MYKVAIGTKSVALSNRRRLRHVSDCGRTQLQAVLFVEARVGVLWSRCLD